MSVINSVLKDLEARESGFTPIEIDSVQAAPAIRRERRPLLLAAVTVLLLAAAAWFYLQMQTLPAIAAPLARSAVDEQSAVIVAADHGSSQDQLAEPVLDAQESTPNQQSPVEDTAVDIAAVENSAPVETSPPNRIVGLQIRESEQEMRMEFVLTEKVVAYLRERGENSFGYHLRDIESQIDAPQISNNPWIRTLDIESSESTSVY